MTNQKEDLVVLLEWAKREGVGLVHVHNIKGGLTIAFAPTTPYASCRIVDVAVQICSPEDTFSKRRGAVGALEKFMDGQVIQLPLLNVYPKEDLPYIVKKAFTSLYGDMSF